MNKRVFIPLFVLSAFSFGQDAFSVTFQRQARVVIVSAHEGLRPHSDGRYGIGGANNFQVAYFRGNSDKETAVVKYATLNEKEQHIAPQKFSVQYE